MMLRPRFDVDGLKDYLYVWFDPNDSDSEVAFVASVDAASPGLVAEAVRQVREEKAKAALSGSKPCREIA